MKEWLAFGQAKNKKKSLSFRDTESGALFFFRVRDTRRRQCVVCGVCLSCVCILVCRCTSCMPRQMHAEVSTAPWGRASMPTTTTTTTTRMPIEERAAAEPVVDRRIWFRRQFEYPHGMFMCTTACMQIGMAVLCGQVNPQRIFASLRDAFRRGRSTRAKSTTMSHAVNGNSGCVGGGDDDHAHADEAAASVDRINEFMRVADIVHGRIETILYRASQAKENEMSRGRRKHKLTLDDEGNEAAVDLDAVRNNDTVHQGESGIHHLSLMVAARGGSPSRMISVNELLTTLRIDTQRLGLMMQEYMVCESGVGTRLLRSRDASGGDDDDHHHHHTKHHRGSTGSPETKPRRRLACMAEGYRIGLRHVPKCMVVEDVVGTGANGQDHEEVQGKARCCHLASIVLATTNGHTVCGIWQKNKHSEQGQQHQKQQGEYALFDSAPGLLKVGLTADELVEGIGAAIRIPRAAWGEKEPVMEEEPTCSRHHHAQQQGSGMHVRSPRHTPAPASLLAPAVECALPNLLPGMSLSACEHVHQHPPTTESRKKMRAASAAALQMDLDRFYCDVTIFFLS